MLVALGHRRNVGKDTIADILHKNYGFIKISFAVALKKHAQEMFWWAGVESAKFYDLNREEKEKVIPALGISYRELLIRLGMFGRSIAEDIWVQLVIAKILAEWEVNPETRFVITDLRFENEANLVQQYGGLCLRVDRDSVEKFDDPADSALADWYGWDGVIQNSGNSLTELERQIDLVNLEKLYHGRN